MSVLPISSVSNQIASTQAQSPAVKSSDQGFGSLLTGIVEGANNQQVVADQAIENFATGQEDNIQNVVVSMAKADLSFRMVMEIRNQLMESYQEIMRMQV